MQRDNKERICTLHKRGMWHFIFVRGLVIWGGSTALFSSLWQWLVHDDPLLQTLRTNAIAFLIAGTLFGIYSWYHVNRRYKHLVGESSK